MDCKGFLGSNGSTASNVTAENTTTRMTGKALRNNGIFDVPLRFAFFTTFLIFTTPPLCSNIRRAKKNLSVKAAKNTAKRYKKSVIKTKEQKKHNTVLKNLYKTNFVKMNFANAACAKFLTPQRYPIEIFCRKGHVLLPFVCYNRRKTVFRQKPYSNKFSNNTLLPRQRQTKFLFTKIAYLLLTVH